MGDANRHTSSPLSLPAATGDLEQAVSDMRDALSEQLIGDKPERPFSLAVVDDDGGFGAPAWSDAGGNVHITVDVAEALATADENAIAALAHQVVHSIGDGPAFTALEEQLLEEAVTETLTQCYLGAFVDAFGGKSKEPPPLLRPLPDTNDLQVTYVTATNVSVERFARIAAWLDGLDGGATDDELEAAALKWSIKMKAIPGGDRFLVLATAAARLEQGDDEADDVGATTFLEDYLRGYMKKLQRSETGFDGLGYALARAWGDQAERPAPRPTNNAGDWRDTIAADQADVLLGDRVRVRDALAKAADDDPELAAAVRRTLDARALLWSARQNDAASLGDADQK